MFTQFAIAEGAEAFKEWPDKRAGGAMVVSPALHRSPPKKRSLFLGVEEWGTRTAQMNLGAP